MFGSWNSTFSGRKQASLATGATYFATGATYFAKVDCSK